VRSSANTLADEEEAKVRKLFDDYCAKRDIPVVESFPGPADRVSASWREMSGNQAQLVGLRGRVADLIAVPRPDREMNLGLNTLTAARRDSGKLVLMCPPSPVRGVGTKIAIAWNGSAEAARAMTAALPILRKADAVSILASSDRSLP